MTVEQQASEYAEEKLSNRDGAVTMNVKKMVQEGFIAGHNKANEWVSVEERLPDTPHKKVGYNKSNFLLALQFTEPIPEKPTPCVVVFKQGTYPNEAIYSWYCPLTDDYLINIKRWKEISFPVE